MQPDINLDWPDSSGSASTAGDSVKLNGLDSDGTWTLRIFDSYNDGAVGAGPDPDGTFTAGSFITILFTDGTGGEADIAFDIAEVDFGDVTVDETSGTETVTVTNNGDAEGSVEVSFSGAPFEIVGGSCPTDTITLDAQENCTFQLAFVPTEAGAASGTLSIEPLGGGTPTTVALVGNGTQGNLTITPPAVNFGDQAVGTTSAASVVTLANTGTATLQVTALDDAAAPFALDDDTCGPTPIVLDAGDDCTLSYVFSPTAAGAANQSLTVTADAPGSGTIELSGTGTQGSLTLTPPAVNFGNQTVGTTSAASVVTLANTGDATLQVTALDAPTAPFALDDDTCGPAPFTIDAGDDCTLSYVFSPTAAGAANQSLTVTTDAAGSGTIALSGTGVVTATVPTLIPGLTRPGQWLLVALFSLIAIVAMRRRGV